MADTPKMTGDWVRVEAMDPLFADNDLCSTFVDLAVSVVIEAFEQNLIDLPELVDSLRVPADFYEKFSNTYGGVYSRLMSDDWCRKALRSSMQVWKARGTHLCYRITFALFGYHIEIGEVWLDKADWLCPEELAEIVSMGKWDQGESLDQGEPLDSSVVRGHDMPAAYASQFAAELWGKTSFYCINLIDHIEDGFYGAELTNHVIDRIVPLIEPIHCRLLAVTTIYAITEQMTGMYGYWYGYGYSYGDGLIPGYAYGDWSFIPQGTIGWITDGLSYEVLDDTPIWDDGGDLDDGGDFDA